MARALSADDTRFIALCSLFFCHLFLQLLFLSTLNSVPLCVMPLLCPCRFKPSTTCYAACPNNLRRPVLPPADPHCRQLTRDKINTSLYANATKDESMGGTYSTHDGTQISVDFFKDPNGKTA